MVNVIRLSSLGDVVLTAAITGQLGEDVCFVTLPRYQSLVRRFPGVVEVRGPGEALPPGRVIDLHNKLRTRAYRADARLDRQDVRRRLRVALKTPPADDILTRYARAAGVSPAPTPWLPPVPRGDALLVVPGAAHATKRWPYWQALAAAWDGPVRALGGPGEEAAVAAIGGVCEAGFDRTIEAMAGGAVLCAGDTGLLHLGAAVGLPVVGLFGPTTSADGFFGYGGTAVERPMFCRPCSRFGSDACPIGDHACMRDLDVVDVLAACRRAAGR
jgi:heptosyltransferase-2